MMLYTIIKSFGPEDGERWQDYCQWRGIAFGRFDSIDGMLRENLFHTPEDEDWSHIVNADYMLHLITDLAFAIKKQRDIGEGEIIGIKTDDHDEGADNFLGYDIIDGYWDISLLTNWGNDHKWINTLLRKNALLGTLSEAQEIHKYIMTQFPEDPHALDCKIISIYSISYSTA